MTEDLRPAWMKALRRLIATTPSPTPNDQVEPTFGTVRSLNPLRIALDSDPLTTLSYAPACLDYPTYVGQRVWVQTYGRQVVVVGVSKSAPDLPVGTGGVWTGPAGKEPAMPWTVAEGQLLLRTDFPELSALYGSTFPGSTATHVALPDARGRSPIHQEAGDARLGTVGQVGGAKDVTLTEAQMPVHGHRAPNGSWMFYVEGTDGSMRRTNPVVMSAGSTGEPGAWRQRLAETPWLSPLPTASAGGGQAHENLPPYFVARYMVKVR